MLVLPGCRLVPIASGCFIGSALAQVELLDAEALIWAVLRVSWLPAGAVYPEPSHSALSQGSSYR